jgi:hypothetical protein
MTQKLAHASLGWTAGTRAGIAVRIDQEPSSAMIFAGRVLFEYFVEKAVSTKEEASDVTRKEACLVLDTSPLKHRWSARSGQLRKKRPLFHTGPCSTEHLRRLCLLAP